MEIKKNANNETLELKICGRLDTTTAPQLETVVKNELDGITMLKMDFAELEYVSSAGLRVLLAAQKTMNGKGQMVISNVCEEVMEVFEITGFSDILTIE